MKLSGVLLLGSLALVRPAFAQEQTGQDLAALQAKAEGGDLDAQKKLGDRYFEKGDVENGLQWVLRAAEHGSADAQNSLGFRYYRGNGLLQDLSEAEKWFRRSAEQGYKYAANNLCSWYDDKLGIRQGANEAPPLLLPLAASREEWKEATTWCGSAARSGFRDAQKKLALLYARGTVEVKPDDEQAYFWLAVQRLSPELQEEIGRRLTPDRAAEIRAKACAC